mmetsp:Transcript_46795/g.111406  ORF Transcript_46795/g.111406 Transcript_46795/m.111406 type:complete len:428 (-) Transcript_46795:493-1776(-)
MRTKDVAEAAHCLGAVGRLLAQRHLECDVVRATGEHREGLGLLVPQPRQARQRGRQSLGTTTHLLLHLDSHGHERLHRLLRDHAHFLGESVHTHLLNRLHPRCPLEVEIDADRLLETHQAPLRPARVEDDVDAAAPRAPRAPRAVHEGVLVLGRRRLNDNLDLRDVDAARGHVRRHQHREVAVAEAREGLLALGLRDVSVDDPRDLGELLARGEAVAVHLGVGEDQRAPVVRRVALDDVRDHRVAAVELGGDRRVADRLRGPHRVRPHHVHHHQVLAVPRRQRLHPGRHGRGPEVGDAAFGGDRLHDLLDSVLEPHLEHLVRLVQDEGLDVSQVHGAPLNVVDDAPGGANHNINSASDAPLLGLEGRPPVDAHRRHRRLNADELAVNLDRELARRRENDALRAPRTFLVARREDLLDDREREGDGLA